MQNNRNPVISNEIAERPIRDILGLRDVTLSWNVQNQHEKKGSRSYIAGPLFFVGALVFSFGKLLSYFFLVVGRETHGLLCSATSRVDGTCACVNLNGITITLLHSTRTNR